MCNKSSHTTIETLKEILSDISEVCNENIDNTIGDKILCNLQNLCLRGPKQTLPLLIC